MRLVAPSGVGASTRGGEIGCGANLEKIWRKRWWIGARA
jgi:hypothetical protein